MIDRTLFVSTLLLAISLGASPSHAQSLLTLDDALEQLDESSLDLEAARLNIEYAERQRAQANALVLPNVQLDALYQLNDQTIDFGGPNPLAPVVPFLENVFEDNPDDPDLFDPNELLVSGGDSVVQNRHDFSGSLTVTQSLFNMRSRPAILAVRQNVDIARAGVDQTRYVLEGAVIQAYFGAVFAQRVVEVREANLALVETAYERALGAFETEVGTRFDVRRAQVDLERAGRDVANAELGHRLAIDALATLLNVDPNFDVEMPRSLDGPTSTSDALSYAPTRPDLVAFELQLERQDLLLRETQAQWYPTVFAAFSLAARRETAFSGDPYSWTLQIGANWLLYDGGVRRAERRARETEALQIELERERVVHQIEGELRALELQIRQERENIASAQLQVDLANETYELAQDARDLGAATTLEVDIAREQLALAELSLVTAEVSLQQLLHELAWRQSD